MSTIVVEVMPKAELLDPAGKAVAGALTRLGKSEFTSVRIGKRFELTVDGEVTDAVLAEVRTLADEMLSKRPCGRRGVWSGLGRSRSCR